MAALHGGTRSGAGRPKGSKTRKADGDKSKKYEDALDYLEAVVRGDEPAYSLRIAAARIVLPFQKPKARAPVLSPPPRSLRAKADAAVGAEANDKWKQKSEAIRAKYIRTKD